MMKKGIALLLLLAGIMCSAMAQKPQVGFLLGINRSNLAGSGAEALELHSIMGGHVGFMARLPLSSDFAFAGANLLYTMKGAKSEDGNIKINLGYIEVPVMLQLASSRFYAEAGPQLSVRVKNNYTDKGGISKAGELADNIKTLSPGYTAGAGIHLNNIRIGLRYTRDISSIVNQGIDSRLRNTGIMLTAGILLPSL